MREKIVQEIKDFISQFGVNPLYVITLVLLLVCINNIKYFKEWGKVSDFNKLIIIWTFFITANLVILTALSILNIIPI